MNAVEQFWTAHTVRDLPFTSTRESVDYLAWRSTQYPLFHDLMGLWGDHRDDVVLDYGCGPANDLVGFLEHGAARHVVGMDVSATALDLARRRLELHDFGFERWTLWKVRDDDPRLPVATGTVDHVYCEGVLHHTSHPAEILAEFHRVLRPGGTAAIMVYNRDSLSFHLLIPWQRQLQEGGDAALTVEDAFRRWADGDGCPIGTAYRPADFMAMCTAAGFDVTFRGGYFNLTELALWRTSGAQAIADERLASEHRDFLREVREVDGYPTIAGKPAGAGGVYWLTR